MQENMLLMSSNKGMLQNLQNINQVHVRVILPLIEVFYLVLGMDLSEHLLNFSVTMTFTFLGGTSVSHKNQRVENQENLCSYPGSVS